MASEMQNSRSGNTEILHTFSPQAAIYEDRAHSWKCNLSKASIFLIVGGVFMGLHCVISAFYQQQPCVSDIYLVVLSVFRNDFCIVTQNDTGPPNDCTIAGTCDASPRLLIAEYVFIILMMIAMLFEGILGFRTAKANSTFGIDKLMCLSKYVITFFEVSLCGLILVEKWRLEKVQAGLRSIPDKEVMSQTTIAFIIYAGLCILPQMIYWGFFLYIIYQYSFYFRQVLLAYQDHLKEITGEKKDPREIELPEISSQGHL